MSAQVGVRTRSRPALAMEPATSAQPSPKRKNISDSNSNQEPNLSKAPRTTTSSDVKPEMETNTVPETEDPSVTPTSSEIIPAGDQHCSSNGSSLLHQDRIKLLDLEVESAQVEMSTCNGAKQIQRKEMNRSSELRENSREDLEITCHRVKSKALTMPTELELEEFFAAAEKDIQKRFQDKYNYDIVKDVPLEGRYEWVQLKP